MRVVVITKNSFTQRDLPGVTKIEKSAGNIVITGVAGATPYTETFVADNVIVFIVSNS